MTGIEKVAIRTLATGVPGLDEVLGGGLPELSFNLIAGQPGSGKTTLAQQIVFANATRERPALYFTVLGEPTIKLLRYQQQMGFFDAARIGHEVRVLNLSDEVLREDLEAVYARIVAEVERARPGIVVVDSFRTVTSGLLEGAAAALDRFVQKLAVKLTSWEVTSFLIGEYVESELRSPLFTVADGVIRLTQEIDRSSVVRKLQVVKMRGMPAMAGLHTFRITEAGVQVFPRTVVRGRHHAVEPPAPRLSTGIPGLDQMMSGGIPAGDTVVIAGASGTGKTTFATRFIAAGEAAGTSSVVVVFEEHPEEYARRAAGLGVDLAALERAGRLRILYLRPLDLSPDEVLYEIRETLAATGATRLVIDSLTGLETALAPTFRVEFRESLYRLVSALGGTGVTTLLTLLAPPDPGLDLQFTPSAISFVCDDIVVQRHVEIEGALRRVLAVVKMRGSRHSHELRAYEIGAAGVRIGESMAAYDGVLAGAPTLERRAPHRPFGALTTEEAGIVRALVTRGGVAADELARELGRTTEDTRALLLQLDTLGLAHRASDGLWRGPVEPR